MKPSLSSVHIDSIVTDMAIGYMQQLPQAIARRVLPVKRVSKPSNKYFTFSKGDFLRNDYAIRMPGTAAKRTGFSLSTDSYSCVERALGIPLPWETQDAADINLRNAAAKVLASQALISEDMLFRSTIFKGGVWTADTDDLVGGSDFTKWASPSTGNPIKAVLEATAKVQKSIGQPRGTNSGYSIITTRAIMDLWMQHNDFLDRIRYTSAGVATASMMAELFQVKQVLVFESIYDTAAEGATSTPGFIYDANASSVDNEGVLIMWNDPNTTPDSVSPTAGAIFSWDQYDRGMAEGALTARSYDEVATRQTVFEGSYYMDMKVTAPTAGVFMKDCIS
jgi:hypothetical protein